jgi:hypothetical protein
MINSRVLAGTNIVLTGEFNSFGITREELSNFIGELGGNVQKSVFNNTTYLVYGTPHGMGIFHSSVNSHPTYKKAESKMVTTISYLELENKIKFILKDPNFSISNTIKTRKEEQKRVQINREILFEEMEKQRKRIFFENPELGVEKNIKTPVMKSKETDMRKDIIDRWANRSVKMGKLMRDKIINERRKLDDINEINWNVLNNDWGCPDPQGRVFICYRHEWYNKRKKESDYEDKIFITERQALIYCCKKSYDCLSEDVKDCGEIKEFDDVFKMNDQELKKYYKKLLNVTECEHEGEQYFYKKEEKKVPTTVSDLFKEVSGIDDKQRHEEWDSHRRKYEFLKINKF